MAQAIKETKRPESVTSSVPMTKEEQARVKDIYERVREMIDLRNSPYPEFNDRTLVQYIDDAHKRLNSYAPSRAAQDKDEWQSNVALPTVRDKLKRVIAGYSLNVPDLAVTARRGSGDIDVASIDRGDISKKLITSSYLENENPIIENFWESWSSGADGTCIKYEGYLRSVVPQKFIKSFDIETGKVEFEEREVVVDDKMISYLMPISEFYISDFYTRDVQDQKAVAWIRYYDKELFEYEFGKYENAKNVTVGGLNEDNTTFFFKGQWGKRDRAGKDSVEVIRYYSLIKDEYIIIANGILLLDAPMLWRFNGRKVYPFAKSILEPFANAQFFYGKSFPDIMMGQYDMLNTYFNSIMDKGFRALNVPTLIGGMNRDSFDLEDQLLMTDTKIYVEDVNQIRPMPIDQVSQADVSMIELLARGLEDAVPSMPHMLQNKEATAREVVITEDRMRELKSIYSEMLVDLWRQKFQLRLANILAFYPSPVKVKRGDEVVEEYKTFVVENSLLDADTGERGILALQFRKLTPKEKKEAEIELSAERQAMEMKGVKYRKKILDPEYFDDFIYRISVIPESLHRSSQAKKQASILEELATVSAYFPQIFVVNQEQYFEDLADAYDRDPQVALAKFKEFQEAQQQAMLQGGMAGEEGEGGGEAMPTEEGGGEELVGPLAGTMSNTIEPTIE